MNEPPFAVYLFGCTHVHDKMERNRERENLDRTLISPGRHLCISQEFMFPFIYVCWTHLSTCFNMLGDWKQWSERKKTGERWNWKLYEKLIEPWIILGNCAKLNIKQEGMRKKRFKFTAKFASRKVQFSLKPNIVLNFVLIVWQPVRSFYFLFSSDSSCTPS